LAKDTGGPFFRLRGDGFWHLKSIAGRNGIAGAMTTTGSRSDIEENFEHAYTDEALYEPLKDDRSLLKFKNNRYCFPSATRNVEEWECSTARGLTLALYDARAGSIALQQGVVGEEQQRFGKTLRD
jgi:hypothetical protein